MADQVVLYRVEDGVAVITLNRPERMNAWTGQLQREYFDHLDEANRSPDVGAIVLTGAGRGFCPGADMDGLAAAAGNQGSVSGQASDAGGGGSRESGGGARQGRGRWGGWQRPPGRRKRRTDDALSAPDRQAADRSHQR